MTQRREKSTRIKTAEWRQREKSTRTKRKKQRYVAHVYETQKFLQNRRKSYKNLLSLEDVLA